MSDAAANAPREYRLDGLEPDNLLAFLALLGAMRAWEATAHEGEDALRVRWSIDVPPWRPVLVLPLAMERPALLARLAQGVERLARDHDFGGRRDPDYTWQEAQELLEREAGKAHAAYRSRADLLAAVITDAALRDEKKKIAAPTPLCLLFGQGHQHFLERLATVPHEPVPPRCRRDRRTVSLDAEATLEEALFQPWHRQDPTPSFRWDPEEAARYALMAGDPTDPAYKAGTQHGANRLAAVGLAALPVVAQRTPSGRLRATVPGGAWDEDGFSIAWPIWREPATFSAVLTLLSHPDLRNPGALAHLSVEAVMVSRRISEGKYMNFGRGQLV